MMAKDLMKWWGASGKPYRTISGVPPLMFIANGQPLKYWSISGNSGGVGEKTDNIIRDFVVNATKLQYANVLLIDVDITPDTTYSFSCVINDANLRLYVNENVFKTTSYGKDGTTLKIVIKTLAELPDNQKVNGKWIMLKNSISEPVTPELSEISMVIGSTVPESYEPYGYRIPVTCGGTTTNIYLNAPLGEGETVTLTETGIEIPTLDGTNILSIGTTVQPSEVYIKGKIKEVRE